MNVYVIQVGQYSDKTLVAAASTQERAEEIVAAMSAFYTATDYWFRDDDFNIYKFELDALPVYVEHTIFSVTYFSHEDRWRASQVTSSYLDELPLNTVETWDATNHPTIHRSAYRVVIMAEDEKTALKAGTERIMQYIAKEKR
jgi:hypothetical protein